MNVDTLTRSIIEAQRYLRAARAARQALGADPGYLSAPRLTGAARRASMDLTRSLADVRRPG